MSNASTSFMKLPSSDPSPPPSPPSRPAEMQRRSQGDRRLPRSDITSTTVKIKHVQAIAVVCVAAYAMLRVALAKQRRREEEMWQNVLIPMITGVPPPHLGEGGGGGSSSLHRVYQAAILATVAAIAILGVRQYTAEENRRSSTRCQHRVIYTLMATVLTALVLSKRGAAVAELLPTPAKRIAVIYFPSIFAAEEEEVELPSMLSLAGVSARLQDAWPQASMASALLGAAGVLSYALRRGLQAHHASRHHKGHRRNHPDIVPTNKQKVRT